MSKSPDSHDSLTAADKTLNVSSFVSDGQRAGVSALVIAKDEAGQVAGLFASLSGVVDEIVMIVDDRTQDDTAARAKAAGATVVVRRFDDYARQRQAALEACTKEWVLWIDCDERVTPELRESIRRELASASADAYALRFAVRFLGKMLRFGGLGSEKHVRLFRRKKARFVGGALHEGLEIAGRTTGPLAGKVEHEPYKDLSEYLEKLDRYTTLAAQKKRAAGKAFHAWQHLVLPWELFRRLVLRLAFLDGFPGVAWACLSAFHHWLKYAKLREMEARR